MNKPAIIGSTKNIAVAADNVECTVKDYIAGMTDRYTILEYDRVMKDFN